MAYKFNPFTGKLEEYGPILTGTGTVAAAADGTAALPGISFANDLSVGIYRPGAEQLAFSTNGTGRLFIDASGNVSVGGALQGTGGFSASAARDTYAAGIYTGQITAADTSAYNAGPVAGFGFAYKYDASGNYTIGATIHGIKENATDGNYATALRFTTRVNGSDVVERLRITSTGQLSHIGAGSTGSPAVSFNGSAPSNSLVITSAGLVGIGTSSPSVRLQVQDSIAGGSDGTVATLHNFSDTGGDTRYVGLNFRIGSDNGTSAIRAYRTNSASNYETNLSFWTNPAGGTQTPLQAMTIDSYQRVGIGTAAPTENLTIYGTSSRFAVTGGAGSSAILIGNQNGSGANNPSVIEAANGSLYFGGGNSWSGGGTFDYTMTLTNDNRVGIGTTSPAQLLHLKGSGDTKLLLNSANNASDRGIYFATSTDSEVLGYIKQEYTTGQLQISSGTGSYASEIALRTSGFERAKIDTSGRLLVGASTARAQFLVTPQFEVEGTSSSTSSIGLINNQSTNAGPYLFFGRTRGTAVGGVAAVELDDILGGIYFQGANGTNLSNCGASIESYVDGTVSGGGANDMPGRLVFSTTADGASSPTEKLRIDNAGTIQADGRNGTSAQIYYSILPSPGTSRNHFLANTVGVGTWALQGNGTSTFTSDERRKKNIETTRDGYLNDINRLRVVKYNWKALGDDSPKELGLIAQEVEQVFPGLISEYTDPDEDVTYKALKHSVLPFMLLKALQEASSKIETLEAKVAALETK